MAKYSKAQIIALVRKAIERRKKFNQSREADGGRDIASLIMAAESRGRQQAYENVLEALQGSIVSLRIDT